MSELILELLHGIALLATNFQSVRKAISNSREMNDLINLNHLCSSEAFQAINKENNEILKIEFKNHLEQYLLTVLPQIENVMAMFRDSPVESVFLHADLANGRELVDRAVLSLLLHFSHHEMCPCCYISFQADRFYLSHGHAQPAEVKGSHILSNHYLKTVDAFAGVIHDYDTRRVSNTKKATIKLLCGHCEHAMGKWEELLATKRPCCSSTRCATGPHFIDTGYPDMVYLRDHMQTRSGVFNLEFANEQSLYRFLIPNLYRAVLLAAANSKENIYFQYSDIMRAYMYVNLLSQPDSAGVSLPLSIYCMALDYRNGRDIGRRMGDTWDEGIFAEMFGTETVDFRCASTVCVLIAPLVICISMLELPCLSVFQVQDRTQLLTLPIPDETAEDAITYMTKAFEKLQISVKNRTQEDEFVERPTPPRSVVDKAPPALLLYIRALALLKEHSPGFDGNDHAKTLLKHFYDRLDGTEGVQSGRTLQLFRAADSPQLRSAIIDQLSLFGLGIYASCIFTVVDACLPALLRRNEAN